MMQKIAICILSHNFLGLFANKARIDNRKNLLSSNIPSTCPYNMANFGPLAAEIFLLVWAPQLISTVFASWQRYCTTL